MSNNPCAVQNPCAVKSDPRTVQPCYMQSLPTVQPCAVKSNPPAVQIDLYGVKNAVYLPCSARELTGLLRELFCEAFRLLPDHPPFAVELILTRDGEMATVNYEQMGCFGPTNVLSFPASNELSFSDIASIILNVDAVRREAKLFGQSRESRLLDLLAHSVGHIMGFSHGATMDAFCRAIKNQQ